MTATNTSRRQFAGLVSGVGIALAMAPSRSILAQSLTTNPKPTSSPVSPNLISNAVIVSATSNITNAINKLQAKTLTSADLAGALVASKTLFDHMQETGFNDQLTKAILADQINFVNTGFTQTQIDSQLTTVSKANMHITSSAYRNSLIMNSAQRQQAIMFIEGNGQAAANQLFLTKLGLLQSQLAMSHGDPWHSLQPAAYGAETVRIMRISEEISTCELGAAIFAMGAIWFPPLAAVAAAYAMLAALKIC